MIRAFSSLILAVFIAFCCACHLIDFELPCIPCISVSFHHPISFIWFQLQVVKRAGFRIQSLQIGSCKFLASQTAMPALARLILLLAGFKLAYSDCAKWWPETRDCSGTGVCIEISSVTNVTADAFCSCSAGYIGNIDLINTEGRDCVVNVTAVKVGRAIGHGILCHIRNVSMLQVLWGFCMMWTGFRCCRVVCHASL